MRFVNSKEVSIIENVVYEGVDAVLFRKGYRVARESTNALPQGTKSPVGSQQNKLPPVKGKK